MGKDWKGYYEENEIDELDLQALETTVEFHSGIDDDVVTKGLDAVPVFRPLLKALLRDFRKKDEENTELKRRLSFYSATTPRPLGEERL